MPKVRPASPTLQQLLRNATLLWRRWRTISIASIGYFHLSPCNITFNIHWTPCPFRMHCMSNCAILHQPDCKYATSRIVQLRLCNAGLRIAQLRTPSLWSHADPWETPWTSNWPWMCTRVRRYPNPTPWNFKLTLNVYNGKKISKIPPRGTSDKPLSVYNGKKIQKKSHPHGTSNWHWVCTPVRRYQISHPHGTSTWPLSVQW